MSTMTNERIKTKRFLSTKELVITALFAALAYVLMLFESPAFIGFLRIELSDVPAIIGAIQYGPIVGLFIELIKNLVKLTSSKTGGVGELANFIVSAAYILPVGILYRRIKGKKKIVLSFGTGIICMAIAGYLMNYYITIPLYTKFMSLNDIINMAKGTIPGINDMNTLILYGITPFNIVKGLFISVTGYLTYQYLKDKI